MCTGIVPHVGGPVVKGSPTVIIGFLPAARQTDLCVCVGPPDMISKGSATVFIENLPAARMGDMTSHGGNIILGFPTVLIGDAGSGGGGGGGGGSAPAAAGAGGGAAAGAGAGGAGGGGGGTKKLKTGLGDDVDKIASLSPTLTSKIEQLQKDGWTIKYRTDGKPGSECDKTNKVILIDPAEKGKPAAVTQTLAHEAGHATYTPDPYVPPAGLTKDQYVQKNTNSQLKDEGEATITNVEVRNEIKKNGGPDIGVAGAQSADYQKMVDENKGSRDDLRQKIGDKFADGETTSTTGQKYRDYYGDFYKKEYDKANPPPKP